MKRIVLNAAGAVEPILHVLREKIQKKADHAGENTVGCPVCSQKWTYVKYCAFSVILPIENNQTFYLSNQGLEYYDTREQEKHPGSYIYSFSSLLR